MDEATARGLLSGSLALPVDELSRILGPSDYRQRNRKFPLKRRSTGGFLQCKTEKFLKPGKFPGELQKSTNHKYIGIVSPDRTIRSLVSSFNEFVVVTNSMEQLTRLARVFDKGDKFSLA